VQVHMELGECAHRMGYKFRQKWVKNIVMNIDKMRCLDFWVLIFPVCLHQVFMKLSTCSHQIPNACLLQPFFGGCNKRRMFMNLEVGIRP
jgi:hypothetical protein